MSSFIPQSKYFPGVGRHMPAKTYAEWTNKSLNCVHKSICVGHIVAKTLGRNACMVDIDATHERYIKSPFGRKKAKSNA